VLRLRPPVHYTRRTVAKGLSGAPTIGRGEHARAVEPGEVVYLSIASANRDDALFDDPDSFVPARASAHPHLSFGVGTHYCLGAALARVELRCLFRAVIEAMEDFAVVGSPEVAPSAMFDALAHLHLRF
jgi:cytochrome P450